MYKLTEEQRWYIIIEWKKGSLNVPEVVRSFNCHRSAVYRVIDYYRRHNDVNYTDRYNAGRPPALNPTQIEQLDRIMQQNRSVTAAELLSLTHFNTTERTIRRYRFALGYRPRKSVIKVKINNSNEHRRYQFATAHHHADIKKYIFEDECYIGLRNTQQIVWCKQGEPTPKKTISSLRAHINLIGFIWWDAYIFYRFNQWLNSDSYCETVDLLLSEHLPQLNGYLYVSDGIKWHRSAQFKQWCHQYDIELCEWPGLVVEPGFFGML
ncbi:unnamed protein product [Rotaria sp. Silwood1]|nr:unnamed protein product [Rotaria sp. Silwood1]CAF3905960.1 unnamed protein product [Rotaria sp. Silwood1]CAF4866447.1 unnamed protein product [Rotaria sp. Silwood1]